MTPFGTLPDGREVMAIDLRRSGLSARILTLGAILNDLRLDGRAHSLTLGSPDVAAYAGPMAYYGAIVGPVANRIGGAAARIDGRLCRFEANQAGRHILHGGASGTHGRIWQVTGRDAAAATLELALPDGGGGFPGNRRLRARYALDADAALRLTLEAVSDAPTLINLAHHPYWNLDGSPTWEGHHLRIAAAHYLPVDADTLPTGAIAPVAGTGFDFREDRRLASGDGLALDHNFCLSRTCEPLREVARLTGVDGLSLAIETTAPGLQVYDASGNTVETELYDGRRDGRHAGLAIEPQFWPDAPNHPDFPAIDVAAGELRHQATRYRFRR